jgi:hypothetical protein
VTEDHKTRFLDPTVIDRAILEVASDALRFGCRAALVGGAAMQLLGSDRMTRDIDFVADGDPPPSLTVIRDLSFGGVKATTHDGVDVDWIVRDDDYRDVYEEALATAVLVANDGVRVLRVVRPEYLFIMKMVAGRAKDDLDAVYLLNSEVVNLDKPRTRAIIKRLLGAYAADDFDRGCEEAAWIKEREKRTR